MTRHDQDKIRGRGIRTWNCVLLKLFGEPWHACQFLAFATCKVLGQVVVDETEAEAEAVSLHDVRPPVPRGDDEVIQRSTANKDATGKCFGISKKLDMVPVVEGLQGPCFSWVRRLGTVSRIYSGVWRGRGTCLRPKCFPVFFLFCFSLFACPCYFSRPESRNLRLLSSTRFAARFRAVCASSLVLSIPEDCPVPEPCNNERIGGSISPNVATGIHLQHAPSHHLLTVESSIWHLIRGTGR